MLYIYAHTQALEDAMMMMITDSRIFREMFVEEHKLKFDILRMKIYDNIVIVHLTDIHLH